MTLKLGMPLKIIFQIKRQVWISFTLIIKKKFHIPVLVFTCMHSCAYKYIHREKYRKMGTEDDCTYMRTNL